MSFKSQDQKSLHKQVLLLLRHAKGLKFILGGPVPSAPVAGVTGVKPGAVGYVGYVTSGARTLEMQKRFSLYRIYSFSLSRNAHL